MRCLCIFLVTLLIACSGGDARTGEFRLTIDPELQSLASEADVAASGTLSLMEGERFEMELTIGDSTSTMAGDFTIDQGVVRLSPDGDDGVPMTGRIEGQTITFDTGLTFEEY